jgi:xanthine dehydrogenase YagS FAD-binding subunit
MSDLAYDRPQTVDDALALLAPGTAVLAGGTDLVTRMKEGLARPARLVDIQDLGELTGLAVTGDGLRIGALTRLADLAADARVQAGWPALAQACALAASPQLRNMGTLGGNLLQDSRCWYYRGPFACLLKGGEACPAHDGENREHALLGYVDDGCVHVHPSDPAVALVALGARVRVRDAQGERELAVEELFHTPVRDDRRVHTLPAGALIVDVRVPATMARSVYRKAMDRAAWTFALASVAAAVELDGGGVRRARVVLGGVAGMPWRAKAAEDALAGQALTAESIAQAARAAMQGARPLAHNGYKVALVQGLVRQALRAVASPEA